MSYVFEPNYYRTPRPVAYADEKFAPVPGWGVHPLMAGSARQGVGALSDVPASTLAIGIGVAGALLYLTLKAAEA